MQTFLKILFFVLATIIMLCVSGSDEDFPTITDVYALRMRVFIPRVIDNMSSLGYRKYHWDIIEGELHVTYPYDGTPTFDIMVTNLYNKSHKIGDKFVTYTAYIDREMVIPRINMIGNNKTNTFRTPSVVFALICDPSYNIGEIKEDNTLYICLSGTGSVSSTKRIGCKVISALTGYLSGTIGCGCSAYGHTSPTRKNGAKGAVLNAVDDVSSVWGQWKAKYKYSFEESETQP